MELHKPVRDLSVSEIEQGAKCAAVEAVEARWKRQDRQRRRAAFRKAVRGFSAGLLLLAIAVGAGYWFLGGRDDVVQAVEAVRTDFLTDGKSDRVDAAPLVPAPLLDAKPEKPFVEKAKEALAAQSDPAEAFRKRYGELLRAFRAKPAGPWRSAPASVRPKNAPKGTVYHALVQRRPAGYDIYEMTAGDKETSYRLLSPIAKPAAVSTADFIAACKGMCYLIEVKGIVYVGGKATEAEVSRLQSQLP